MTGSQTHKPTNATRASNKAYAIDWNQIQELPDDCVSICLSYKEKYALLVQCKYLHWRTRYDNLPEGTDIAAFAAAIETALMSECECIDCEYLTNCLQPLFDQITDALAVMQRQLNRIEYGYEERPGNQLPPDKLNGNMAGGSNPTCDLDILWAQCIQLIEMTNDFITDVLERIESSTNAIDAAEVIGGLPFIDEFGGDSIQAYVQILNEGIAESYASQYTVTLRDEMACALFCMCKDDCTISIERVNRLFVDYLAEEFGDAPSLFANISALMSYLIDGSIESDVVVYVMYLLWWGIVGVGGTLAGLEQSNYTLAVILQLAADSPSPDWELLCIDCPEPWVYEWDFGASSSFTEIFSNAGTPYYAVGEGLHINSSDTFVYMWGRLGNDRIPAGTQFSRVELDFEKTADSGGAATDDIFVNESALVQDYDPAGEYRKAAEGTFIASGIQPPIRVGTGWNQGGGGWATIKRVRISDVGPEPVGLVGGAFL